MFGFGGQLDIQGSVTFAFVLKKKSYDMKILEAEPKIVDKKKRSERLENEKQFLDCMKENLRMFYSSIKKK